MTPKDAKRDLVHTHPHANPAIPYGVQQKCAVPKKSGYDYVSLFFGVLAFFALGILRSINDLIWGRLSQRLLPATCGFGADDGVDDGDDRCRRVGVLRLD